ncbi:MAG: diguanylate cyclase [Burkholderiales bacterium]|jgi:GGDEF domain-containing protein|nr:diguanylate cyclase [Burkholderiales bacterium]MBP6250294.1 diguanylate cyclase [Leptothrix sp. (in: b-proteobacteria)]MBP7521162.1 diguanylate cyclase [Leptothrix sp. (in: b-proteobacteria)]HQY10429.1 diguanylate cyclase [Burkholderiaceae bacterium]
MSSLTAPLAGAPLQVLCVGLPPPTSGSDGFGGRLIWEGGWSFGEAATALNMPGLSADVVVIRTPADTPLMALAGWSALAGVVERCAVVVCAAAPVDPAAAVALLRLGVQDVLPGDGSDAVEVGRAVWLAAQRWRMAQEQRRAWSIDLDTGLISRQQMLELLQQLCALREREPAPMALVVLRTTAARTAEMSLGGTGLATLRRKLGVRLRAAVRASDLVAAVGRDAFAVLLTRLDRAGDGPRVAAKLSSQLRAPLSVSGQPLSVDVAVGLARFPEDAQEAGRLLDLATSEARRAVAAREGAAAANDP